MSTRKGTIRAMALLLCAAPALGGAVAQEAAGQRTAFKVCADPNALPESNEREEGFENRLARLFAADLGLPVQYAWFPKRIGFARRTLYNNETEDGSYKCDVIMGVVEGFERGLTTKPYYGSTWAMVYVKGRGLDDVLSQEDLVNLPPERKEKLRIGLYDRGPATDWAFKHGLLDYMVPYQGMTADPDDYPGKIIVEDLVQDKINLTFVWGPVAGYYAKVINDPQIVVIPMRSEPGIQFDFRFAMAVRFGEKEWLRQLDELIDRHREEIRAMLTDYGVPLLEGPGVQSAQAAGRTGEGDDEEGGPGDEQR